MSVIGYGASLRAAPNTKGHLFTFAGSKQYLTDYTNTGLLTKNLNIEGLSFLGNSANLIPPGAGDGDGWNCLRILFCSGVTVKNCNFTDSYNKTCAIDTSHNVTIQNCQFDKDLQADAIYIYCDAIGGVYPGTPDDKNIKVKNVRITGCSFNNHPRSAIFTDGFIDGCIIDNNIFGNKSITTSTRCWMGRLNAQNIIIKNNVMVSGGAFAWARGMNKNITIDNNTIVQSNLNPILISGLVGTDYVASTWGTPFPSNNIIISNNSISDGSFNTADSSSSSIQMSSYDGTASDGNTYHIGLTNIKVINNTVTTTLSTPSIKNNFAVRVSGTAAALINNLRIINNTFEKNQTQNVSIIYVNNLILSDLVLNDCKDTNMAVASCSNIIIRNITVQGAGNYGGTTGRYGIAVAASASVTIDNVFASDTQAKMSYIINAAGTDIDITRIISDTSTIVPLLFDNGITYRKQYDVLPTKNSSAGLSLGSVKTRIPVYDKLSGNIQGYYPVFDTIYSTAQTNITGTSIDLSISKLYKSIAADTTLSVINGIDGRKSDILLTNSDITNSHIVTINSTPITIPANSSTIVNVYQINGVIVIK